MNIILNEDTMKQILYPSEQLLIQILINSLCDKTARIELNNNIYHYHHDTCYICDKNKVHTNIDLIARVYHIPNWTRYLKLKYDWIKNLKLCSDCYEYIGNNINFISIITEPLETRKYIKTKWGQSGISCGCYEKIYYSDLHYSVPKTNFRNSNKLIPFPKDSFGYLLTLPIIQHTDNINNYSILRFLIQFRYYEVLKYLNYFCFDIKMKILKLYVTI